MKKSILVIASICVVLGFSSVPAQTQVGGVRADVPFNFTVLGRTFEAGEYVLIAGLHRVEVEDHHGNTVALALANDITGRSVSKDGEIVFHCYTRRCFLSEVWSPSRQNGRQLLTSRSEAELAKEEQGKYFAVLGVAVKK